MEGSTWGHAFNISSKQATNEHLFQTHMEVPHHRALLPACSMNFWDLLMEAAWRISPNISHDVLLTCMLMYLFV